MSLRARARMSRPTASGAERACSGQGCTTPWRAEAEADGCGGTRGGAHGPGAPGAGPPEWTLAKRHDADHAPSVRGAILDFDIGYFGTAALAVCFLFLGAGVMYGAREAPPAGAAGFAVMVLNLYTETLGDWARYLIGACAMMVMFSTTLTVVDGFPRALNALAARFRGPEVPGEAAIANPDPRLYWTFAFIVAVGSLLILEFFMGRFKSLVDLATTISFFTAPVLAYLNHRAVTAPEVPEKDRPSAWLTGCSLVCIGLLAVLAMGWGYVRFR